MAKPMYERWLTPEGLTMLTGWARDGLTMDDIAHNCGVTRETLRQWRKQHPAISAALIEGREVADIRVENALYKRALGYTCVEVRTESKQIGDTMAVIREHTVTKHVPPDVLAQIYWLKNRRPDRWRDKPVDSDGADTTIRVVFEGDAGEAGE